jgi:CheY-like chemotaxis protein
LKALGFKGIVAMKGALGLSLARQFLPTAISLDIFLPDMLGWTVHNQLKLDPATRHIPVQIATLEEERQHGLSHGAFSYLVKPVDPAALKKLLAGWQSVKT